MKDATNNQVACQGIGGDYKALLAPNTLPKGTDQASIDEAVKTIQQAMTACPNAKVVMAGYRYVRQSIGLSLSALTESTPTAKVAP
jgi:cutinase